jgi:hypothetical protein
MAVLLVVYACVSYGGSSVTRMADLCGNVCWETDDFDTWNTTENNPNQTSVIQREVLHHGGRTYTDWSLRVPPKTPGSTNWLTVPLHCRDGEPNAIKAARLHLDGHSPEI